MSSSDRFKVVNFFFYYSIKCHFYQMSFSQVLFDQLSGHTLSVPSMPAKQWNFHKAKWSDYIALTNKFAITHCLIQLILDIDAAY